MNKRFRAGVLAGATIALFLASAAPAAAQLASILGRVTDESGQPIEGAVVVAENPDALPSKAEVTTKKNGEFTVVGIRGGNWMVTVMARGFLPVQLRTRATSKGGSLLVVKLARGAAGGPSIPEELKADFDAAAALTDGKQYAEALAAYESLEEQLPDLTAISLRIAHIHRQMKNEDKAIAVYDRILAKDPANDEVRTERALTLLAKGDLDAAEAALTEQAQSGGATAETYYNLGEVKFARAETEAARVWYEKAAAANPSWGKPLFKLGLVELNKNDTAGAKAYMQRVIDVDPSSVEASQAQLILKQLP